MKLSDQQQLPLLDPTARRQGVVPLGDRPAQFQLRHRLPGQRLQDERLLLETVLADDPGLVRANDGELGDLIHRAVPSSSAQRRR